MLGSVEPVTHMLTGAILARTGLNRRAAYATVAMAIAAEFPDIDTLWSLGGPIVGFQHHRGITHTFIGVPFEALLLTCVFYGAHRLRNKQTKAPANWIFLFGAILLALLSHIFLDWTNNYGVRPFFPFNPRWYAGSFVFIFEPLLFLFLLIGLAAPALFGLINTEVGAGKVRFAGRGWAIAALVGASGLWTVRFLQHDRALQIAQANAVVNAGEIPDRFFASPYPLDPFTWHVISAGSGFTRLATVDTRSGTSSGVGTQYQSPSTLPLLVAKRSALGAVYLDWSMFPVIAEQPPTPDGLVPVVFRDARFLYGTFLLRGGKEPLSGTAFIDMTTSGPDRVDHVDFGGRTQR